MPTIRWLRDEPAVSPALRLRLDPGEQDVSDEQYAALASNPYVELVQPATAEPEPKPTAEPIPEPEPIAELASETPTDTPPQEG